MNFSDIFIDDTKNVKRINSDEYLIKGSISVIDQGKELIAGYASDDVENACYDTRIIFGDHTRIFKYIDFPFVCGADGTKVLKIIDPSKINYKYMYYYLLASNIPNTGYNRHFKWVKELSFKPVDINSQMMIVNKLDKINNLIDCRKKEIEKCDNLIKSQFVEMFGNPLLNIDNSISMTEVCEIIDGDRGNNYPKQSDFYADEYCLFLNAKNVTDHGFDFSNNVYITKEKDEQLRKGKLKRGDVILTTRGTVGNLAFYDKDVIYENIRINSGMVILRMDKEKINERFFIEQFRFQLDNIKFKIANGSAQPQLPISKMNAIKLLLPDIEFQNKFAQIAEQIDKQKFEFENSLKKLEELQASLMQEYFG